MFVERGKILRSLTLPCGQCFGCRLERSRQWAMRCMHEAAMHKDNAFVTLTYAPEYYKPSLDYRDFQLFMKRARQELGSFRFYMCGEYGERTFRPHFHALLFGLSFADSYQWRVSSSGFPLFRSPILERLWPQGSSEIGEVTFESAAYVARYVMKKRTGPRSEDYYRRVDSSTGEIVEVVPEFTRMSLKPGIGRSWIEKFHRDVYPHDKVVVNGMQVKPPIYYDRFLNEMEGTEADEVEFDRYKKGLLCRDDSTPERLEVREKVARARLNFKHRDLE